MNKIKKILIANRGEIAIRIAKAAKKLNVKSVAIYSDEDNNSAHRFIADENYNIGNGSLDETYLNINSIIDIAKKTGCEAVHPGYGFLAENHKFAERCKENGIIFIGPSAEIIEKMGNKVIARDFVQSVGVSIISGIEGSVNEIINNKSAHQFPLLVKAAAGGGGKGMRIVKNKNELEPALTACSREAKNYFGNGSVFVEKYLSNPRHIEVQLLGDNFGNVIHLFERECSIQRRYQKIIEESPATILDEKTRENICSDAVKIAEAAKYVGAGTIEFLLDENGEYYFLEMNTRVQVEHPVTETVTGVDIVAEQIRIADGEEINYKQSDIKQSNHAIECRVYAEDSENNFIPSPGKISFYQEPKNSFTRIDSSLVDANEIKSSFDPMISKVIATGKNRDEAISNMMLTLNSYHIHGIKTNIRFLKSILADDLFKQNKISTKYCENIFLPKYNHSKNETSDLSKSLIAGALYSVNNNAPQNIWESIGYWRNISRIPISLNDNEFTISFKKNGSDNYQVSIENKNYVVENIDVRNNSIVYTVNGIEYQFVISEDEEKKIFISDEGNVHTFERKDLLNENVVFASTSDKETELVLKSSMPGKVIKILVNKGDEVNKDDELVIIESMKMENSYTAKENLIIDKINIKVSDNITSETELIIFRKKDEE
jgi:acetyl-CoA carboxylase biotin carboxylase subunit